MISMIAGICVASSAEDLIKFLRNAPDPVPDSDVTDKFSPRVISETACILEVEEHVSLGDKQAEAAEALKLLTELMLGDNDETIRIITLSEVIRTTISADYIQRELVNFMLRKGQTNVSLAKMRNFLENKLQNLNNV
jgi:hypothetical protein